jgi:hypothetical protein
MTLKIRIIGAILGFVVIFFVSYLVRRQKLSTIYSLTWYILGATLLIFSIFKNLVFILSDAMGIHFAPLSFFVLALFGQTLVLIHLSMIVSEQFKVIKKLEKEVALISIK